MTKDGQICCDAKVITNGMVGGDGDYTFEATYEDLDEAPVYDEGAPCPATVSPDHADVSGWSWFHDRRSDKTYHYCPRHTEMLKGIGARIVD
jgi:hypothetical protein